MPLQQADLKLYMRHQIKIINASVYAGLDKNTPISQVDFKKAVYAFGNLFIRSQAFN